MIRTGLVSVTFRERSPEEIIDLTRQADLQGIEWGGDIHVPHGHIKRAREVAKLTIDSGLAVAAYGSYYRVGVADPKIGSFESILETAVELRAPSIRVWAWNHGSQEADAACWHKIVEETRQIADLAKQCNMMISFEYHGNTLTDTNESAIQLMRDIDHDHIRIHWQPSAQQDVQTRLSGLAQLLPWLHHLHVFHWQQHQILPLEQGQEEWSRYQELASQAKGDRFAMLEFVKEDDPKQFLEDAKVLNKLFNKRGD